MRKRNARRTILILVLLISPAFMNGCILTDLLGGLGGGGGLGGLLGGAGGAGGAGGGLAAGANAIVAPTTNRLADGTTPAAPRT